MKKALFILIIVTLSSIIAKSEIQFRSSSNSDRKKVVKTLEIGIVWIDRGFFSDKVILLEDSTIYNKFLELKINDIKISRLDNQIKISKKTTMKEYLEQLMLLEYPNLTKVDAVQKVKNIGKSIFKVKNGNSEIDRIVQDRKGSFSMIFEDPMCIEEKYNILRHANKNNNQRNKVSLDYIIKIFVKKNIDVNLLSQRIAEGNFMNTQLLKAMSEYFPDNTFKKYFKTNFIKLIETQSLENKTERDFDALLETSNKYIDVYSESIISVFEILCEYINANAISKRDLFRDKDNKYYALFKQMKKESEKDKFSQFAKEYLTETATNFNEIKNFFAENYYFSPNWIDEAIIQEEIAQTAYELIKLDNKSLINTDEIQNQAIREIKQYKNQENESKIENNKKWLIEKLPETKAVKEMIVDFEKMENEIKKIEHEKLNRFNQEYENLLKKEKKKGNFVLKGFYIGMEMDFVEILWESKYSDCNLYFTFDEDNRLDNMIIPENDIQKLFGTSIPLPFYQQKQFEEWINGFKKAYKISSMKSSDEGHYYYQSKKNSYEIRIRWVAQNNIQLLKWVYVPPPHKQKPKFDGK